MHKKKTKPSTGPPQALISRIDHLQRLLNHLPLSLPLDPVESNYQFYLDEDKVAEAGTVFPIAGRALELSFGTWKRGSVLRFEERGTRLAALGPFLKNVVKRMSAGERENFKIAWIDRLVTAATESGAVIPSGASKGRERESTDEEPSESPPAKKSRVHTPIIPDSADEAPPMSIPSTAAPKQTLTSATIPATSNVNLTTNAQATLETMGWQGWVPGAKDAHFKQTNRVHREGVEEIAQRRKKESALKKDRERELTAARQRQFRARKRAEKEAEDDLSTDDNAQVVLMRGADAEAHKRLLDVAETSRAGTQGWRDKRNGREGGAVQKKAATVNWFHPFLFGAIEKEMRRTGWSPSATVKNLQKSSPLYKGLHKGTISRWRVKGKNEWGPATLEKIATGRAITASGRTGPLARYPEITENAKDTLKGLRTAGAIVNNVNVSIARGVLLAEIEQQQPQLLVNFKVVMDWTPRKATRQARHIPEDAPSLIKRTFFRLRYAILTGRIPPELVVNADQAGNYLLPASGHTFHDRGAKQVDVVAKDEKRAYTMMLASTPAGDFLPIQAPTATTPQKLGDLSFPPLIVKKKGSHFSTLSTMEAWVRDVIAPWRASVLRSRPDLDDDQLMIVYIDIYPVHIGQEFRLHIFSTYPYIILIFVPGGCTGLAQPADVGLQRIAKHILKQDSLDYLVDIFKTQSTKGIAPKDVTFPSSLPILRNATVRGLVKMYDFFQTPEGRKIVKQVRLFDFVLGANARFRGHRGIFLRNV
ncbi:hypothetical protein B0H17DRAFT_1061886 [Mycena rosella]|uniref:DDE-1 domain-containing protein n=1 Tax=Mycena rosella TaxID=1033263 RepID=A0AAD7DID0_MYCRO|nr:hypothetical protein B0H17DRAFT_1061886 [Mycena rosella]